MGLKETVKNLPVSPGVYMMKSASGEILYVGKADNLRKRVSSYFQSSRRHGGRIESLVSQIADISILPTATSAEALIYENGLIKQLSPKYNVALRDDKSYPMLKITIKEKFPRLMITRERSEDGAMYYGPYTSAKLLKEALKILQKLFPLRTCNKMPNGKCLEFDIGQCLGPCEGRVGEERYGAIIKELRLFLEGRHSELLKLLTDKMTQLSKDEKFEEATECRDRLEALGSVNTDRVKYGPSKELDELKSVLGIKTGLEVIEAFDISNIMGDEAVGSLVYFRKGKPDKDEYRKFKIKTVSGMDDYSMMREIVRRRYTRSVKEKKRLPDLIVIDGGRGHLSVALDELKKLGLDDLPVIGIAKEFERIYLKDKKDPILLPKESKALHLLERIRDEAHRFAITYHKKLMSKRLLRK
ncbi:MAG: excinuclease ABC subunit UvrC [Candidatus Omnitrophota bacterium]|nr:excinuclease ABC subunit UvrC [Candidatus Omnitrophota bacterium]